MTGLHADQSLKTKILKAHGPPNERFLIEILLKNAVFGSSERLPPLSAVPPTNKKTHPPISKPHPATKSFVHHSFLMCKCFCFCATATSTLHCLMFLHPPPRGVFGPSVKFQDAKTEKKHHLPNDGFLIKILLKNDVFGAQKGYPPWARSPPQIKRRTPQLVNPTQPGRVFFPPFFSHLQVLLFFCNSYINIALPDVSSFTSQGKNHLPNDQFLIKILLKNDVFGSSERLPPLSAVPPTNKTTHPPISKPHPATKSFFPPCFSHVQVLCFCATATSTLHCQMFPHPPPRDMFGPC